MKCPKCGVPNPAGADECDGCGVQFADLKRERKTSEDRYRRPQTCSWSSVGIRCQADSVMEFGGGWYCRAHGYKVGNFGGMVQLLANQLPKETPSAGAERWRLDMREFLISGRMSYTHELIDGVLVAKKVNGLPGADEVFERERVA